MPKTSTKPIILDRDGVINEDLWGYVTRKEEFKPISGSLKAIQKLTAAGFTVVVATNQACISKKIINKKEDLDEYITKIPKNITIVPKIESSIGVDNIESITNKLEYKERIIMLDHDDLYIDLLKLNIPTEKFSYYMNKLIDFCKTNNILLLRTVGIIFTNEDKNVSDYIR